MASLSTYITMIKRRTFWFTQVFGEFHLTERLNWQKFALLKRDTETWL